MIHTSGMPFLTPRRLRRAPVTAEAAFAWSIDVTTASGGRTLKQVDQRGLISVFLVLPFGLGLGGGYGIQNGGEVGHCLARNSRA